MQINEYGKHDSPIILIQPVDDHDLSWIEIEAGWIKEYAGMDFRLITVKTDDWFSDLTPWSAPAAYGDMEFGDGAKKTLEEILKLAGEAGKQYIIGGYSLAGLFALWAGCQTDAFAGVAAASPSVWYPGFSQYMECHRMKSEHVYLSLGDREEKTRNPIMAAVGERIREIHASLESRGINCCLEWNEGNHFRDPDLRTARAFAWVMKGINLPMHKLSSGNIFNIGI